MRKVVKDREKNKLSFWKTFVKNIDLTLLMVPGIICYIIWSYLPMFGIIIAFKRFIPTKGILGSDWVGFENFKFFFTSQDATRITINTLSYGIIFMITGIIAAVFVALLLFEITNHRALKIYQSIIILPHFLSWVIVGYISYILLNPQAGTLNQILGFFKIAQIGWYAEPKYWPYILTLANLWKHIGMSSIVYYAALMGVDAEMFEAATLDGANKWQRRWYILIPSLIPLMIILSILGIGNIFRGDFGLFYQLSRDVGTLYPTTDIIDTYVYRGLRTGDMSITAAVGLIQSFVGVILVVGTNLIVKKIDPDSSLF